MIPHRLLELPAFEVIGKKGWIAGTDDSGAFGRFWEQCKVDGTLAKLEQASGFQPGPQTKGRTLGISRTEHDPSNRAFFYMIAIEKPAGFEAEEMESYQVPASHWAIFECRGKIPEAIIEAEMFAFMQWLPASGFQHARAPEMEVYLEGYCEFWLPVELKS